MYKKTGRTAPAIRVSGTIDQQNIRDRVALPKMVFMPISHSELLKVPSMDQNPGWDR